MRSPRSGAATRDTIVQSGIEFDMLFGPAYKGIALVVATAGALAELHGRSVPFAFNRKEAKDHGEGGMIIGSPLAGRVLIIDDVITAGTAIRQSADLILGARARLAGVVLALDRQERGQGKLSAVQEVENTYAVSCVSIITLSDLIESLTARRACRNARKRCAAIVPSTVFSETRCGVAHLGLAKPAGS